MFCFQVTVSKNVVEATKLGGLIERLETIQTSLGECEKALMDYMETKRLSFPRFYFVSHNDLLDILSHGNEPEIVNLYLLFNVYFNLIALGNETFNQTL